MVSKTFPLPVVSGFMLCIPQDGHGALSKVFVHLYKNCSQRKHLDVIFFFGRRVSQREQALQVKHSVPGVGAQM